jgi:acetolactate decarboxylase
MYQRKLVFLAAIILIIVAMLASLFLFKDSEKDTLYQVSAFNVFASGNYNGNTTFAELAKHGDFGIGTLNGLNGEMIALDGKFYQIPVTGVPREIGLSEKTPYATVNSFENDFAIQVENVSS